MGDAFPSSPALASPGLAKRVAILPGESLMPWGVCRSSFGDATPLPPHRKRLSSTATPPEFPRERRVCRVGSGRVKSGWATQTLPQGH